MNFKDFHRGRDRDEDTIEFNLRMDAERAKSAKSNLRVLCCYHLVSPFIEGVDANVNVEEIWLFDFATGEIYSKLTRTGKGKQKGDVQAEIARLEAQLRDPHRGDYVDDDGQTHPGDRAHLAQVTREIKAELESLKKEAQKVPNDAKGVKERNSPVQVTQWRTWTDSKGRAFEARYGGIVNGRVRLVKQDGSTEFVLLGNLSEQDQAWIKNPNKTAARSIEPMAPNVSNQAATKAGPQTEPAEAAEEKAIVVNARDEDANVIEVQKPPVQVAEYRTWTDSSGIHKIEAKFGGIAAGKVKLIKRDGTTIQLPLEKLSEVDREWIKSNSP